MGRYYSGDIEGKFWFAVQESDDASFFGGKMDYILDEHEEEIGIYFIFTKDDLPDIKSMLSEILEDLGEFKEKLDNYFSDGKGYNREMMAEIFGVSAERIKELLSFYARLELGNKILACIKKTGKCEFECEL